MKGLLGGPGKMIRLPHGTGRITPAGGRMSTPPTTGCSRGTPDTPTGRTLTVARVQYLPDASVCVRRVPAMTTTVPLLTVDAFTDAVFGGNPAAVCLLNSPATGAWMQRMAAELNLSETAFLETSGAGWKIRWFSPEVEVPLCGHATLAGAHVLYETGRARPDRRISFDSMSGPLHAWKEDDRIGLDFPAAPAAVPGVIPGASNVLRAPVTGTFHAGGWRIAEVESEAALAVLSPDFTAMAACDFMVLAVTAKADAGADYACRVFGPKVGINEDPVTGSVQCALGPLWAKRLAKAELQVRQRSKRGGSMTVRIVGDRVHLLGRAVTVLTGTIEAPASVGR